jgi:outer membrane protein
LQQSKNQAAVTRQQVDRLNIMNQSGAIAPALLYDLKGQLANDELAIVDNRNAVNNSKLVLAQLMNVPFNKAIQVEKISADTLSLEYKKNPQQLYETALKELAIVKAADLRREGAMKGVQVARGLYYPTVSLAGSFNTIIQVLQKRYTWFYI